MTSKNYKNMKEALADWYHDNKKGKTNYEAMKYVDKKLEEFTVETERGLKAEWFVDCLDIKSTYNILPSWSVIKAIELIEKELGFTIGVKIVSNELRFECLFRKCI